MIRIMYQRGYYATIGRRRTYIIMYINKYIYIYDGDKYVHTAAATLTGFIILFFFKRLAVYTCSLDRQRTFDTC